MSTKERVMDTQLYVLGFLFSPDRQRVALIRKAKPDWQKGLLNGIGGKVEFGEDDFQAMAREFREETGYQKKIDWRNYCAMEGIGWEVSCFVALGDVDALATADEEEPVEVRRVEELHPGCKGTIENLPWLIALALDSGRDWEPAFTKVLYTR
ncbi:MAG: NUDIX hydrolase [Verrucomicrobiales bacterium]